VNWQILSLLLFSLANGGYYSTSYSRFRTGSFLTHQFYLSDYKIGHQKLDLSLFRTDTYDSVTLRLAKDIGYEMKIKFQPYPSFNFSLLSSKGGVEDKDTLSLSNFKNNSLGGELLFQQSYLILHSILKGLWESSEIRTFQDTNSISDKGREIYNELKISQYGLALSLLLYNYTLGMTQNRAALYIEPTNPLLLGKSRVNFRLSRSDEDRNYPVGEKNEERSLSDYRGFLSLSYPLLSVLNIELRKDFSYNTDRYQLLKYKGLTAKSDKIEAIIDFTPTDRINTSLVLRREESNTTPVLKFGEENRNRKFLNCKVNYEYKKGYVSFSQRTSLESINTPYPLNKNDRDLLDNEIKASGKLTINSNIFIEWRIENKFSDVIYVERFMGGNSFSKKGFLIEGEVDIQRFFNLHLTNRLFFNADRLSYPFASRRDNLSKKKGFSINLLYEDYPSLIPQLNIGSSFEDYGGYLKGYYEPEVFYTKPRLSLSLLYHPFPEISITPTYEVYRIETTTIFWKEPFNWRERVAGLSGEIRLSGEGFLSFDIKRERRENEKDYWLANISINYNF